MEVNTVTLNPSGTINGKHLCALNERMHFHIDDPKERTNENSFRVIFLIKSLLLCANMLATEDQAKGKSLLKLTPRIVDFKALSPAEQYFFLLEMFIVELDWVSLSEELSHCRYPMGLMGILCSPDIENVTAGQVVDKESQQQKVFWSIDPFMHFGEFFGWWTTKFMSQDEYKKNQKSTHAYFAKSLTFTEFGAAILPVLGSVRSCVRWNRSLRKQFYGEKSPVPGSPLSRRANAPTNVFMVMFWDDGDMNPTIVTTPYKKGEPFYAAFTTLVEATMLTKTIASYIPPKQEIRKGTYIFKVSLSGQVWRRVALAHTHTLENLHDAIQKAFRFDDDHLYAFFMDGKAWSKKESYSSPRGGDKPPFSHNAVIGNLTLRPKQKFLYIFDYGDDWRFDVVFEGVDTAIPIPQRAVVIESKGKAPSQYGDGYDDVEEENTPKHILAPLTKASPDMAKNLQKVQEIIAKRGSIEDLSEADKKNIRKTTGWEFFSITISYDILTDKERGVKSPPPHLQKMLDSYNNTIFKKDQSAERLIPHVELLNKKYPDVFTYRLSLRNIYAVMNDHTMTERIAKEIYEAFPDYLLARIFHANDIVRKDPEAAYKLVCGTQDLHKAFPKRKVFHFLEVLNFASFMADYHLAKHEIEAAWSCVHWMEQIEKTHPLVEEVTRRVELASMRDVAVMLQQKIASLPKKKAAKVTSRKQWVAPTPKKRK